jgi:hypothetical protein
MIWLHLRVSKLNFLELFLNPWCLPSFILIMVSINHLKLFPFSFYYVQDYNHI